MAVANELNIEVKRYMRKAQIVRSIAKDLIDCEDYPEYFNESVLDKLPPDPRQIESVKVKLASIEAEKVMIEAEKARFEAESRKELKKKNLNSKSLNCRLNFNSNVIPMKTVVMSLI